MKVAGFVNATIRKYKSATGTQPTDLRLTGSGAVRILAKTELPHNDAHCQPNPTPSKANGPRSVEQEHCLISSVAGKSRRN